MKKNIKILLYLLLILILFYLLFIIRNVIIINKLSERAENIDYSNYQLTVSNYCADYTVYTDIFFKDDKYIQKMVSIKKNDRMERNDYSVTYICFDGINEVSGVYADGTIYREKKEYSKPIYTLESFNRVSLIKEFKDFSYLRFYLSCIKKQHYKGKEVYNIGNILYVDCETGLCVKYILDDINYDIDYNFNEVDDNKLDINYYKEKAAED